MNIRSNILKTRNLPTGGHKIAQIKAKPYGFILLFLCLGIALLWTRFFYVGIIISLVFCYYLLFVKDMLLVEFFDTHVIFYLNNGNDECLLIFWEDIYHWDISCSRKDLDALNIILKNDQSYQLKCLGRKKIERYFKQYAGNTNQETTTKQQTL